MKHLNALVLATGLLSAAAAHSAAAIFVTEPAFDGFNIQTMGFNGSSFEIQSLSFDFTATTTTDGGSLVIDGSPSSISAPAGGTATFFGGGGVFGFNFTSFGTFEIFSFGWDPDSTLDGSYGATGLDLIGGVVTAQTTGGVYQGTFQRVGTTMDVTAALAPVPETSTYALLMAGLLGVAAVVRRRVSDQA